MVFSRSTVIAYARDGSLLHSQQKGNWVLIMSGVSGVGGFGGIDPSAWIASSRLAGATPISIQASNVAGTPPVPFPSGLQTVVNAIQDFSSAEVLLALLLAARTENRSHHRMDVDSSDITALLLAATSARQLPMSSQFETRATTVVPTSNGPGTSLNITG